MVSFRNNLQMATRLALALWCVQSSFVSSLSTNARPQGDKALAGSPDSTRRAFFRNVAAVGALTSSNFLVREPSVAATPDLPTTGAKAPAFELPNSRKDGTTSLAELVKTGKWTVLYFYPG